ncbi:DUF3352 domain-containing protein [Dactylococcopsis salina]|uniref:DUF3352 domain-containing protein n=1 Tax=Dactylococcopsis salina (strain PCC 8305) TaxID=13035 RepID=K9YUU5_DACS8|nr:DUF3352 domain-containing protein [Dactylococcopsis salina]AFZ50277.1 Protein of unknown function (DUF3352) [Dactylococcopsis salina PCC 8305]
MKFRSFLLTLITASLIFLALFAVSLNWLLQKSPLIYEKGGVVQSPTAAQFVSKQAPIMASLVVDVDRLEAYRQLRAPLQIRSRSRQELDRIKSQFLASRQLDYDRDIKPWLGEEITLAVTALDFDRDRTNGVQPGYLLVTTTDDQELAREFLQAYYSRQAVSPNTDLVFERYKGINITYRRPLQTNPDPNAGALASAVVGDHVLFANHPKVLREAINNIQVPSLSLEQALPYQKAQKTITNPRIGQLYLNLPAVAAWITQQPALPLQDNQPTLTAGVSLTPDGLKTQTALLGIGGEENRDPALTQPINALNYIPSDSVFTAAGVDLNQLWNSWQQLAVDESTTAVSQQLEASLQERLGISIPDQIFPWVKGEYAVALLPTEAEKEGNWVFVAETVAPEATKRAIEQLDEKAKQEGYSVGNLKLGEQQVTAWTVIKPNANHVNFNPKKNPVRLNAEVKGIHGKMENYQVFGTSIEAISQGITKDEDSLINREAFQSAIAQLPPENDGYLYLDWEKSQPLLEQQFPLIRIIELAGKPLFDHLQILTLASEGTETGVRKATVFLQLTSRR